MSYIIITCAVLRIKASIIVYTTLIVTLCKYTFYYYVRHGSYSTFHPPLPFVTVSTPVIQRLCVQYGTDVTKNRINFVLFSVCVGSRKLYSDGTGHCRDRYTYHLKFYNRCTKTGFVKS